MHHDRNGWTLAIGFIPADIRDVGKWWTWGVALMRYRPKRWLGVSVWCPWRSWYIPLDNRPRRW